jgi:hypothetical protein
MKTLIAMVLALLLSACASGDASFGRAAFFYETEKFTLTTLEVKPDPASPVEGTIGVRQRVATVVPRTSKGDAGALMSSFDIVKGDGKLTVETALITGTAVGQAKGKAGAEGAGAFLSATLSPDSLRAREMITKAQTEGKLNALAALASKPYSEVEGSLAKSPPPFVGLDQGSYTPGFHRALGRLLNLPPK